MKKRLRKKKRIGEFSELGFRVRFRLPADLSADERHALLDAFVAEAIEAHDLVFGGVLGGSGPSRECDGFVTIGAPRGSVSEEQRRAVEQWLAGHATITGARVYPLVDANYGDPFEHD